MNLVSSLFVVDYSILDLLHSSPVLSLPCHRLWRKLLAFAYDAVMSVGFGACAAKKQQQSEGWVDGLHHTYGIRDVNFTGWSGRVALGRKALDRGGTRIARSMNWAIVNYIADLPYFGFPHLFYQNDGPLWDIQWQQNGDSQYRYKGNTTTPVSSAAPNVR